MSSTRSLICAVLVALAGILTIPTQGFSESVALAVLPLDGQVTQNDSTSRSPLTVPGTNIPLYIPGSGNFPGSARQELQAVGNLQEGVYQRVTAAFFRTRQFQVVERGQLARVLQEARLQHSVLFDERTAVQLGRLVGARQVVVGSYKATAEHRVNYSNNHRFEYYPLKLFLNLRLVDVENGRVVDVFDIAAAGKHANLSRAVAELLNDVSAKLDREVANHFQARGYVIRVIDDDRLLIDLGSAAGVSRGDKFLVYERGGELVHPVTGKIIGGGKIQRGEVVVESVDRDTAVVELTDSKGKVTVGMGIEAKPKKAGLWEGVADYFNR